MNARVRSIVAKHTQLEAAHSYNTGQRTAIFAADVGIHGEPSFDDDMLNRQSADYYALYAPRLFGTPLDEVDVVYNTTPSNLENAILDKRVRSILLIGHAAFGLWLTSKGPVTWKDAGEMVGDHLKTGVFANLGCGEYDPSADINVPLGNYVVGGDGMLLGKNGVVAETYRTGSLDYYEELDRVIL